MAAGPHSNAARERIVSSRPAPSTPSLVLLTGNDAGRRAALNPQSATTLGRSLRADLTFPNEPSLSRLHIRLEPAGDAVLLHDLGSRNGTLVNGVQVTDPVPLVPGDVVRCGAVEFRFELTTDKTDTHKRPSARRARPATPRVRAVVPGEGRLAVPSPGSFDEGGGEVRPTSHVPKTEPELPLMRQTMALNVDGTAGAATAPPVPAASGNVSAPAPPDYSTLPLAAAARLIPLWQRLTAEQIALLATVMTEQTFPTGAAIVRQGDDGATLYVILSGQARISHQGRNGKEMELAVMGPGGFFGEMSLLDGMPRSATVWAVTDVRCALLQRADLEAAVLGNPRMALQMLAVLSARLRALERRISA